MQVDHRVFSLIFLLFVFLASSVQAVEPLVTGSTVTIRTMAPQQSGNNPITWSKKNDAYPFKLSIKENGDREYIRSDGIVNHAYDKLFTNITWQNKPIPRDWRFTRLPPDGKTLQPEMAPWTVPGWLTKTDCQPMTVNYTAVPGNGPDVILPIDGKDTVVKTIKINYEAVMPGCSGSTWKLTQEILYQPDFKEIVSSKTIGWDVRNPMFLSGGSGFEVTAIQTLDKNKAAGNPSDKAN